MIETFGLKRDEAHVGKERVENIQALRGIACLMVLFCHLGKYEGAVFQDRAFIWRISPPLQAGVDLFFVISGFVMITITAGRFQKQGGSLVFFLRRAARIYPLYWFYTLVYVPIFFLKPDLLTRADTSQIGPIATLLLIPHGDPLVGQAWSLIFELYFYLVFALLLLRPERDRFWLLFGWGSVMFVLSLVLPHFFDPPQEVKCFTNHLTIEFILGCAIAWMIGRGVHGWSVSAMVAAPILFLILVHLDRDWDRVLVFLPPAAMLTYGAVAIEARHRWHFPLWLRWTGDISYSLYLSHVLSLSVFRRLWLGLNLERFPGSDVLFLCVSVAGAVAVAALSYRWVEKPLLGYAYPFVTKLTSSAAAKGQSA